MADGALFKEQHRQTSLGLAAANDAAADPGANDDDVPMTGGGPGGQALSDGSSRRRGGLRHLYTPNLYQPTCLSAMFAILPLGPGSICQFERRASDTRNHCCPVRRPERSVPADHKGRNARVRACPVRFLVLPICVTGGPLPVFPFPASLLSEIVPVQATIRKALVGPLRGVWRKPAQIDNRRTDRDKTAWSCVVQHVAAAELFRSPSCYKVSQRSVDVCA
jgi:hypothetical protein